MLTISFISFILFLPFAFLSFSQHDNETSFNMQFTTPWFLSFVDVAAMNA